MSIYIVQGPRILGCWGRGGTEPQGRPTLRTPQPLHPGFARPAHGPHLRFSLFCSRGRTKRENNKNAIMRFDPRCALCGPRGAGALKKGLRRGHGRPFLALSCTSAMAARQPGLEQIREAPRRRRRRPAQARPGGATPLRSPRDPGPRPGLPLLATLCDRSSCHSPHLVTGLTQNAQSGLDSRLPF